jgi:hypothetical protein
MDVNGNSKLQIPNNKQITMTEIPNSKHVWSLDIGIWNLFVIWCLEFEIWERRLVIET